ncbi:MAG: TatD family hydrolase [Anaplasmataceae bacterium]|nr:TatD family hydrolase [Anaplasmataceae bacterium]
MKPKYFDAHTHVQFAAYDDDREEVIKRSLEAEVWMLNVGTQYDTSKGAIELAEKYDQLFAAVGLHPIHTEASYHDAKELGGGEAAKAFTSRGEDFNYKNYKELALHPRVVAIGECGLDYYRLEEKTKDKQKEALLKQITLAKETKRALMIHCRDAFPDLIALFKEHQSELPDPRGVIHFFSGTIDDARELANLGFGFTFGGVVTFTRDYDEVIKFLPIDRILSETDAPYVTPMPHRGKRNESSYIPFIVQKLAEIKGVEVDFLASQILRNAGNIFKLSLSQQKD